MNRKTAGTLRPVAALLALAGLLLAGCTTVYHPRYGSDGVYYDDGPYYGEGPVVHRSRHAAPVWVANPVIYPYWSLDYFYFSHYVHPYSVYVGYHEPYYYPYPGWTLGHYWSHHGYHHRPRFSVSVGYGWGYPWSAYGWHYPSFAFGFFSDWRVHHHYGYARHHRYHRDRLRAIDQRIDRLRFRSDRIDRRALLAGRDDRGRAVPWTGTSGTVRTLAERGPSLRTEPTLSRRDAVNRAGAERGSMRDGLRRGSSASPRATTGTATPRGTIRGRGDFRSREAAPSRRGIPMDRFESRSRRSDALSGSREAPARTEPRDAAPARSIRQAPSRASGARLPPADRGTLRGGETLRGRGFRSPSASRPSSPPPAGGFSRPAPRQATPALRSRSSSPPSTFRSPSRAPAVRSAPRVEPPAPTRPSRRAVRPSSGGRGGGRDDGIDRRRDRG